MCFIDSVYYVVFEIPLFYNTLQFPGDHVLVFRFFVSVSLGLPASVV